MRWTRPPKQPIGLLAAEKPADTKDEDWKTAKANSDAIAYKTLGWVAMTAARTTSTPRQNFKKSLTDRSQERRRLRTGSGRRCWRIRSRRRSPRCSREALYDFARAAAYDGPGALTPDGRQKIDAYLTKVYTTLHGDTYRLGRN